MESLSARLYKIIESYESLKQEIINCQKFTKYGIWRHNWTSKKLAHIYQNYIEADIFDLNNNFSI